MAKHMPDIYLKLSTELAGDSTDTKHAGEIEILSFSHKIYQPKSSTASTAGGHTAERTVHDEMFLTKQIDKATSKLFRACSAGTLYPTATLTFYRAYGGSGTTSTSQTRVAYLTSTFKNVVISSMDMEIGGDGELPAETIGIRYSSITHNYMQHKIDGSSASTGPAGWDLSKNVAI